MQIHVRKVGTGEIVHSVEVKSPDPRRVERVVSGLLRNMGDGYYVDDSEADGLNDGS